MPSTKWLAIGKILKPWGIKGQVKLITYNPESLIFSHIKTIFLSPSSEEIQLEIQAVKPHGKYFILKLKGYENPESVSRFCNHEVYIARDSLPPLKGNEVYLADLEGLQVLSFEGEFLGTVQGFQQVGGSEVMLVGKNREDATWVPYIKEFIAETSLKEEKIHLTELATELFELD